MFVNMMLTNIISKYMFVNNMLTNIRDNRAGGPEKSNLIGVATYAYSCWQSRDLA